MTGRLCINQPIGIREILSFIFPRQYLIDCKVVSSTIPLWGLKVHEYPYKIVLFICENKSSEMTFKTYSINRNWFRWKWIKTNRELCIEKTCTKLILVLFSVNIQASNRNYCLKGVVSSKKLGWKFDIILNWPWNKFWSSSRSHLKIGSATRRRQSWKFELHKDV
jgi:hypothetical protein